MAGIGMQKKPIAKLWLLVCLWLLSACGFQLQGYSSNAQQYNLPPLNVIVREQDPRLKSSIQAALNRQSIQHSAKGMRIVISKLALRTRDISLTTRREATEQELLMTLNYEIQDKPLSLSSSRVYTNNPNAVLSSQQQRRSLEQEMINELSDRMLQQLITRLQQTDNHEAE